MCVVNVCVCACVRREGVTDLSIPSKSFLCVRDMSAEPPNAPCETSINQ